MKKNIVPYSFNNIYSQKIHSTCNTTQVVQDLMVSVMLIYVIQKNFNGSKNFRAITYVRERGSLSY